MKTRILLVCILSQLLYSCKPTEHWALTYAAKKPIHYGALTSHFIRAGGCKADTTTKVTMSDSAALPIVPVIIRDTISVPIPGVCNVDTTLPDGAHLSIKDGTITFSAPVHDSIHYQTRLVEHSVRDLSEENLLRDDSLRFAETVILKDSLVKEKVQQINKQSGEITKLQFRFWGLVIILVIAAIASAYLKLKPKIL